MNLVVLESPKLTLGRSKLAREFFSCMLSLRFGAYAGVFPDSALPASSLDFISDHLIVYDDINSRAVPVATLKIVPLDRCEYYNLKTSVEEWLSEIGNEKYLNEFKNYVKQNRKSRYMAYAGSLAINPEYMMNRDELSEIRTIVSKGIAKYSLLKKIDECFSVATPTSRKFLDKVMGCTPLFQDRFVLETYNSSIQIVKLTAENSKFMALASSPCLTWDKRIHISSEGMSPNELHVLSREQTRSNQSFENSTLSQ